jgi:hypothetical protein
MQTIQLSTIALLVGSFAVPKLFQSLSLPVIFTPKKEGGKFVCYWCFRSAKNAAVPIITAIAIAASIATSVVISDVSVASVGSAGVGSVGANSSAGFTVSAGVGSVGAGATGCGSGSIGVADEGASSTIRYVSAYEP